MRLMFVCKTNCPEPYVNYAEFTLGGKVYVVDRHETDYGYAEEDGMIVMEWLGLHIWDGERELPVPEKFFEQAEFNRLVVEDDAPNGYELVEFDYAVL